MAHLSDEDKAELVAYLDGELDDASAQALEARLARDPRARAEAETLRRTWELLDYLPRAEASTTFTHRTLERLAVQSSPSRPAVNLPGRGPRWLRVAAWAAAVLLAVLAGLAAANRLWPAPPGPSPEAAEVEAQLVRNLRVIENKRLYEHVDDLEFLRDLDHPDLFGDDTGW
jgi:anti-sigma factor RsiW